MDPSESMSNLLGSGSRQSEWSGSCQTKAAHPATIESIQDHEEQIIVSLCHTRLTQEGTDSLVVKQSFLGEQGTCSNFFLCKRAVCESEDLLHHSCAQNQSDGFRSFFADSANVACHQSLTVASEACRRKVAPSCPARW